MLEGMQVHPQDQHELTIEEIRSPQLGAEMLEFCESELLFPAAAADQNSEVASTSNCCCYEDHSNSYQTHELLSNMTTTTTTTFNPPPPPTAASNNQLPFMFDEDENDISASIDFTTSPSFSSAPNQEAFNMYGGPERWGTAAPVVPLPLSTSHNYEDQECLPPPYIRVGSSQHAHTYLGPAGIFMQHQQPELDYHGDNTAIFLPPDTIMPTLYNCSSQLQGVSESQHVVHGGGSSGTTSSVNTSLASEISSLDDATFKVGKISVEERRRKIHRYMKKRNERNFSKKIKYACRKTLADSRPRVRGRFAKNDELMMGSCNHEDETDHEDITLYSNSMPHPPRKVVLKEEEDHDSSEIYAHISSFKFNYPIKSWIN